MLYIYIKYTQPIASAAAARMMPDTKALNIFCSSRFEQCCRVAGIGICFLMGAEIQTAYVAYLCIFFLLENGN